MAVPRPTYSMLTLILGSALSAVCPSLPAWSAGNQAFDGTWNVAVACKKAPDGALAYTWLFSAEVHDGSLLGNYHKPGTIPSGTLSGRIEANGDALLIMQGLTGNAKYSFNNKTPGTPFHYTATTHFDADHGTGKRNEIRECTLDFVKR